LEHLTPATMYEVQLQAVTSHLTPSHRNWLTDCRSVTLLLASQQCSNIPYLFLMKSHLLYLFRICVALRKLQFFY
jgi:hypothetical protein